MRLGAHVSVRGALPAAVDRALALRCECLQIFVGNPRQWRAAAYPAADLAEFRHRRRAAGLEPLVAHAPYLIQLGTADGELRARVVRSLTESMRVVEELEGLGVVTHLGSARGAPSAEALRRAAGVAQEVLAATRTSMLLLENSAGGTLGSSFEELRELIDLLGGGARVGVCLDSAHLFAAGWDLRDPEGVDRMLREFDAVVGLPRLHLLHLNDSKFELGSRRDRHENIGEGHIGREGFRVILAHPAFRDLPFLLEVPGFPVGGKKPDGPDKENVDRLRAIRDGVLGT
jgi:deoxyribonuclease-4